MTDIERHGDYRGMRALMLLRVSTPEQEKGFGWPSQEREIRNKLVEPLALKLDEQRHIIRDTYTGLEFRHRPVLDQILDMARRQEFDLLVTDVLDRLGRKGIARELYRMQLRELGVRILTTDPNDHADDDSLIGEMVRLLKGYQSEEELNNIRRRTINGKRAKAEGRNQDGTIGPRRVVGLGSRLYGYKFVLNEHGRRENLILNTDVILTEEDGTEWTEVKVVTFIFEAASKSVTIREICRILNAKGIPSPNIAKGIKTEARDRKEGGIPPVWQPAVISRMLRESGYWGEKCEFKTRNIKVPGKKYYLRRPTSKEEQIIVPVPAIVSRELAETALKGVERNKRGSARNNKHPEESLLRAGLVKCGYCGRTMSVNRDRRIRSANPRPATGIGYLVRYTCARHDGLIGKCTGASISATIVDNAAWERALTIVNNPSEVDEKVNTYRSADPTESNRKRINKRLAEIRKQQENFRQNLAELMKQEAPDQGTIAFLNNQLGQLADQERGWKGELSSEEDQQMKWKKVEEKLDELHKRCTEIRESLNDPNYVVSYKEKRELVEFFGITARVWRPEHHPRFKIECRAPEIVSLISKQVS